MHNTYHLGLLNLVHLLVSADGVIDENELAALNRIKEREKIPSEIFDKFQSELNTKKERDIYVDGIELINKCTDEEKMRAFVILYKMSEVDGRVHVKEVRLLLYSIRLAGIEFDDVVKEAAKIPSFY
jgi:uncharacterized tellurite resistance protein B-like protein